MIHDKCELCGRENTDVTILECGSWVCFDCYRYGATLLFKGMYTKQEFLDYKEFLERYNEKQKHLIKLVMKIVTFKSKEDISEENYIEAIKDGIDKVVNLEAEISLTKFKKVRTEILKKPREHNLLVSFLLEKDNLLKLFSIPVVEYGLIKSVRLKHNSNTMGSIVYATINNYYNGIFGDTTNTI